MDSAKETKIKTLYVNGDSWTVGTDLEQDPLFTLRLKELGPEKYGECVQSFTWGANVMHSLGASTCINQAQAGGSNARILRTTCEFVQSLDKDEYSSLFVAIGWTHANRQEIHLEDEYWIYNPNFVFSLNKLRSEIPYEILYDVDRYQKLYTTHILDEYQLLVDYFQQKYLLANYLESLGIRYYFFDALEALPDISQSENKDFYYHKEHLLNAHNIKTDISFFRHCKENDIITDGFHTLVSGHEKWSDVLRKDIYEIYPELK